MLTHLIQNKVEVELVKEKLVVPEPSAHQGLSEIPEQHHRIREHGKHISAPFKIKAGHVRPEGHEEAQNLKNVLFVAIAVFAH